MQVRDQNLSFSKHRNIMDLRLQNRSFSQKKPKTNKKSPAQRFNVRSAGEYYYIMQDGILQINFIPCWE